MSKNSGYKQAGITQLSALRNGEKKIQDQERAAASALLDDKSKRKLSKEQQRKQAAAIMAKSLVNYPKNPHVWEFKSASKEDAGKPKTRKHANLAEDVHPRQAKAARKVKQIAAKRLLQEEKKAARLAAKQVKLEARAKLKLEREAKHAEKLAERNIRKTQKAELKRLASLPTVTPTPELLDSVMDVIVKQFALPEKMAKRQRKFLEAFAKAPAVKQARRTRIMEIKLALMQGWKLEAIGALKAQDAGVNDTMQAQAQETPAVKQPKKKVTVKPAPKLVAKSNKGKKAVNLK